MIATTCASHALSLRGATAVYITGRERGQTSALLGYYSANGKTLFKTVVLRVTIQ